MVMQVSNLTALLAATVILVTQQVQAIPMQNRGEGYGEYPSYDQTSQYYHGGASEAQNYPSYGHQSGYDHNQGLEHQMAGMNLHDQYQNNHPSYASQREGDHVHDGYTNARKWSAENGYEYTKADPTGFVPLNQNEVRYNNDRWKQWDGYSNHETPLPPYDHPTIPYPRPAYDYSLPESDVNFDPIARQAPQKKKKGKLSSMFGKKGKSSAAPQSIPYSPPFSPQSSPPQSPNDWVPVTSLTSDWKETSSPPTIHHWAMPNHHYDQINEAHVIGYQLPDHVRPRPAGPYRTPSPSPNPSPERAPPSPVPEFPQHDSLSSSSTRSSKHFITKGNVKKSLGKSLWPF